MSARGGPLPRSTPAEQGVDPGAVLSFLDAVAADPGIELHGLVVVRHGHVVAEGWWAPYSADRPTLLYSLSKSFTSAAAGFAQAEGLLDLDDTVLSHFPELDAEVTDPRSRAITLRHAAAMASGHTGDMADAAYRRDPDDPVRGFLTLPPEREPGTVFAYNQPCTYSLAAVVQRRAGMPLTAYLRPRLFDPLGIGEVGWEAWPPGRELGFTGLHARTEDVAKLGQLHLQRGRWDGTQLLPEEWVAQATTRQVDTSERESPDWRLGYGYQFWTSRHGYRGDGAFGQFCLVLPEQDSVVAMTAGTTRMQEVLDAVWTHLLPGLGRTGAAGADRELADRLAGLRLDPCKASGTPTDEEPWRAASFVVAGDPEESELTTVSVARTDEGWQVTLTEAANAITFPLAPGEWAVSTPEDRRGGVVPLAASGGWLDQETLRVEVLLLETPHRLALTCSTRDGHATASWPTGRPLGRRALERLRRPA